MAGQKEKTHGSDEHARHRSDPNNKAEEYPRPYATGIVQQPRHEQREHASATVHNGTAEGYDLRERRSDEVSLLQQRDLCLVSQENTSKQDRCDRETERDEHAERGDEED